ncbi:tetratricopeptide repeat protein [Fodinibius sp. Rm-B-1B1-1]|uniref:tetratricopeptide repeat protein n=1 Tax=Fodinibius alkaliphilus TaxID=3140241 RepID=UPI00315B364B
MNKSCTPLLLILTIPLLMLCSLPLQAQQSNTYFEADRLLRAQKYEEAAQKFEQLYQNEPYRYLYLNKLTESLINLKEYDKAIAITQEAIDANEQRIQAKIRLGELYHISGDNKQALIIWDEILSQKEGDQQAYLNVARTATERKEYQKAIEIYQQLKTSFSNSTLIASELGETYMQAGNYEQALKEFLNLVQTNPDRLGFVQRQLIRARDDYIYDIAILEISDFLEDLSADHPSYQNLQQLEIWLLVERKLYKRAVATAKNAEAQSPNLTYTLYNLGSKLLAAEEFKLAEQAYSYYVDNNVASLADRSKEELGKVYIQWAQYLADHNLDLSSQKDQLYQKALETLEDLQKNSSTYHRLDQVLLMLSDLALDVFHDPEKAQYYLEQLKENSPDNKHTAQEAHIRGRLYLYNQEYTQARISFSKSNNQERIGDLAQKNRYYLALTDFFAGDYEFAKIQLNALERQTTSYYANDAVKLRIWIQKGLQADSSGAQLQPFANFMEHLSHGKHQQGITTIKKLLSNQPTNPMIGYALLELDHSKNDQNAHFVYRAVSSYLKQQGNYSPIKERLMWVKAQLADQIITNDDIASVDLDTSVSDSSQKKNFPIPQTTEQLIELYEELLLQYPNGFYATYVRNRIQELEEIQV